MATYAPLCGCANRGYRQKMITQVLKRGLIIIKKYTCPVCRETQTIVSTNGDNVTQARLTALQAL